MSLTNTREGSLAQTEEIQTKGVDIVEKRYYDGPNIHAMFPVVQVTLDLGDLVDVPSDPGFAKKLVSLLPELKTHTCSKNREGGFVERLNEGTYPAHIIEHIAISLQNTIGSKVSFGKSRRHEGDLYHVVMEYEVDNLAMLAISKAVYIFNKLVKEEIDLNELRDDVEEILEEAERVFQAGKLGPSTKAILEAAKRRNIPFKRVHDDYSLFSLGWGKKRKMIWGPVTSSTAVIGSDLGKDKDICKDVLYNYGFPVPRGCLCRSLEEVLEEAERIGYPVVIKPVDGHHGEGVLVNLKDEEELREAYEITTEISSNVLVEQYLEGDDFRFLIIGHKVVGVARRIPAHVVGDGKSNIKELVNIENQNPERGEGHAYVLTELNLGEEEIMCLKRHGLNPNYVPSEGEIIYLREVGNISTGGTSENYTDITHPTIKRKLERISKLLNLDLMGVDIIAENVTLPENNMRWGIIEVNTSPGLRMHIAPSDGTPIPVGDYIVENMYPQGDGRIPLVAITGTNGKTTTSRLVEWIARCQGYNTGLAVTGGIYSNGKKIEEGDTTGPWSANMVLQNPDVDFAVLETARGGIVKRGLGYDKCSVGVITNIREDHIGSDGIQDIEDIFWIKSIVTESVDPRGYSVINAKDVYAERLMRRARGRIVLFSTERNELIDEHIEKKGITFLYEDGGLIAYIDRYPVYLSDVNAIPYLMGGVEMMVENTLAAVAAAYSSGISLISILDALKSFELDEKMSPGRLNTVELGPIPVVLDYAHNQDALRGLGEYSTHLNSRKNILVFAGVGDREDEALKRCGEEASTWFDEIIITENLSQLRGRKLGEMTKIIAEGVSSKGKTTEVIIDHEEAITRALQKAGLGDTVFVVDLDLTSNDIEKFLPVVERKEFVKNEIKVEKKGDIISGIIM
ncbi:MAG: cyanophycin synthetase [Candidatus Saliniplasma sp.]